MSISEFFAMGGYGFFVWMSYGVTALLLGLEIFLVLRNKRTILQRLARSIRLNNT